jgi:hypothetical protein
MHKNTDESETNFPKICFVAVAFRIPLAVFMKEYFHDQELGHEDNTI